MSYDIYLRESGPGSPVIVLDTPHDLRGGTYAAGGTREAWLDVTYNYAPYFYRTLGDRGIRTIYGMTGADSIPVLRAAADQLADGVDPDYWRPTEGNAKAALLDLIALAERAPNGVWDGD